MRAQPPGTAGGNEAGTDMGGARVLESDLVDGRQFVSNAVEGHDLVAGTAIVVAFHDGTLTASAGCNRLVGPYHLEDADGTSRTLVIDGHGLVMTQMGCDPDRHAQDRWLAGLLQGRPTLRVPGTGEMSISDGTSTVSFVERDVADPDRPLVGTVWTVDSILAGAAASSVPGSAVTFRFGDDGRLMVASKDCASVRCDYEAAGGVITFGAYRADDVQCPSPWGEALALLDAGTATVSVDGVRLTLTAPDGHGLSLRA